MQRNPGPLVAGFVWGTAIGVTLLFGTVLEHLLP